MSSLSRRGVIVGVLVATLLTLTIVALRERTPADDPISERETPADLPRIEIGPETRWMAVTGGAEPESTQVSIEQDLMLAMEVLGDEGLILFGGGPGVPSVQERDEALETESTRIALADLFDPRGGRRSRYRAPRPRVDAAASALNALDGLETLLEMGREPLLVFVAGHGEPGEQPADNLVRLWGAWPLAVRDVAEVLDTSLGDREVRLVMATCFAGGFAELAFRGAEADQGPALTPRCGLFASPWDDESSGCVPDPDRSTQDGYAMHLLHALGGRDARGEPLPRAEVDLDGDGAISLLEAHTRARVASRSIDVPTTTSERWLRHVAVELEGEPPGDSLSMPEEETVVASLGRALSIEDEASARSALEAIEASMERRLSLLEEVEANSDEAFFALRISLLERWPVLEDPWHPDFEATLSRDADAIDAHLETSREALQHRASLAATEMMAADFERLRERRALILRLTRAHETRRLAGRLEAEGGEAFAHYQRLLACERGRP